MTTRMDMTKRRADVEGFRITQPGKCHVADLSEAAFSEFASDCEWISLKVPSGTRNRAKLEILSND